MENRGGNSLPAQPKARSSAKICTPTIPSVLGKRVCRFSRFRGSLPKLRIVPDDHDEDDKLHVKPSGLRFGGATEADEIPRAPDENKATTSPTTKPGGLRFGEATNPVSIANQRHSSIESEEDEEEEEEDEPPTTGCNHRPKGRTQGRNTMGFNNFMKTTTRCSLSEQCSEDCGIGTGCTVQCRDDHGIPPESVTGSLTVPGLGITGTGAPGSFPAAYPGAYPAPSACYNGRQGGSSDPLDGPYQPVDRSSSCPPNDDSSLNSYVTLLLEIFGVLIFFAICTITFWVTLVYQFIKLLVELKNADRNIQVAVAIVFGLLFVAFAICHVTSGSSCCSRPSDRSANFWSKGGNGCRDKYNAKRKTSIIAKILSQIKNVFSFGRSSCRNSRTQVKKEVVAPCCRKKRFSDSEGQAIFVKSRRYAIPTEMKQPPTILLWLMDRYG